PKRHSAFAGCAEAKIGLENYQGAIVDLDKAIELSPRDAQLYELRGVARNKLLSFSNALTDFDQAYALGRSTPEVYYGRGYAKSKLGRQPEAISDFTTAIEKENPFFERDPKKITYSGPISRTILDGLRGQI